MLLALVIAVYATAAAYEQSETKTTTATTETETLFGVAIPKYSNKKLEWGKCKPLTESPPNGRYKFVDPPHAEPGQEFDKITLEIVCDPGYGFNSPSGLKRVYCEKGYWLHGFFREQHKCVRFCKVPTVESVEFRCPVPIYKRCHKFVNPNRIDRVPCPIPEGADQGYRSCKEYERNRTEVQPVCKSGYHGASFKNVTCSDGKWYAKPDDRELLEHSSRNNNYNNYGYYDEDNEPQLILGPEVTSWKCNQV